MPQFSILMPAFEAAGTLPDALASIQAQTLEDWELVLVDDGSTDDTAALAREAARKDPRIRVIGLPHRGLVAALNTGLQQCRAPWTARLDADDMMTPERLAAQARVIDDDPELALVGGAVELFPPEDIRGGLMRYVEWLNELRDFATMERDLFVEAPVSHGAATFRTGAVRALGGYRHGPFPEDYDLWLRLWKAGHRFASCPEVVLHWRHRAGRLTFSDPRYAVAGFRRLKLDTLLDTRLKGHRRIAIAGAGRDGKAWARELRDRGLAVSHWVDVNERKIGQTIHGAPVLSYGELPSVRDELPHLLISVGIKGAREHIRQSLTDMDFVEKRDFTCIA